MSNYPLKTAAAIYTHLGNALLAEHPLDEGRLLLRIEYSPGGQEYSGIRMEEDGQSDSLHTLPSTEWEAVEQLHRLTTARGNNRWNLLYFTLMPGGAFEVDFIQDEDRVASSAYLARTQKMPEDQWRAGYLALMKEQAQVRAGRLFTAMSGRLPALVADWLPDWQRLVVRAEHWNGGIFLLEGFAYTDQPVSGADEPDAETGEEFSVVQDWDIVKQFYEFNHDVYQPSWNRLEWTVRPDGTYSLVFDWDPTDEPSVPRNVTFPYTRQGQWQEPA